MLWKKNISDMDVYSALIWSNEYAYRIIGTCTKLKEKISKRLLKDFLLLDLLAESYRHQRSFSSILY